VSRNIGSFLIEGFLPISRGAASVTPGSRKQKVASPLIGCQGTCFAVAMLAAARTLMQIVPRAGWAFGFMHSVLVGEFASVESTSSLLSSNRFSVSPFYLLAADIYLASTRAWLHVRVCTGLPRNARQYRPICIWEAALQAVSNFRIEHRGFRIPPFRHSAIHREATCHYCYTCFPRFVITFIPHLDHLLSSRAGRCPERT
jgi:hypothetical protein